ncbi:MAG: hypothetical protein JNL57_08780 [Bacteroidetes bacterium]|nr:hypothetical protein [Bacteroidota bacterium]
MGNVAGPNMIVVLLLVFLIVIAAFSLIFGLIMLGGLFIAAMVSLFNSRRRLKRMRNEAIKYIMDAPLHAPDSRRAEYEIRSLRMLRTEMSWPQAQSKVIQIRKMMNDDPANPWYSLLKQTAAELQIPWTAI